MKVKYTLPVRGKLKKNGVGAIQFAQWLFRFESVISADYVEMIIIEISDIPRENWPVLVAIEQDPNAAIPKFPFAVNPNAHTLIEINPQLINLESYLGVFGLEEIVFSEVSVEWIAEDGDESVIMLERCSIQRPKPDDPYESLSDEELARCIIASNKESNETFGLAHFRIAQNNFSKERYIETIRHAYLCLEQLFAPGKHQKGATIQAFKQSEPLKASISRACFNDSSPNMISLKLREKYDAFQDTDSVLKFLFKLRGELQHAKPFENAKWHPSRQHEFQDEALFLINLAGDVCFDIVTRGMRSAPVEQ